MSPAPTPTPGWDKPKRFSKNAMRSRAYYSDPAAKAVLPPTGAKGLHAKPFVTWMQAVRRWLEAGEVAFEPGHAPSNGPKREYEQALRALMQADDGMVLGVKTAKAGTLTEVRFPDFLRWARERVKTVDERWGMRAVKMKEVVEEYWRVVEGRC